MAEPSVVFPFDGARSGGSNVSAVSLAAREAQGAGICEQIIAPRPGTAAQSVGERTPEHNAVGVARINARPARRTVDSTTVEA